MARKAPANTVKQKTDQEYLADFEAQFRGVRSTRSRLAGQLLAIGDTLNRWQPGPDMIRKLAALAEKYEIQVRTLEQYAATARLIPPLDRHPELTYSAYLKISAIRNPEARRDMVLEAVERDFKPDELTIAIQEKRIDLGETRAPSPKSALSSPDYAPPARPATQAADDRPEAPAGTAEAPPAPQERADQDEADDTAEEDDTPVFGKVRVSQSRVTAQDRRERGLAPPPAPAPHISVQHMSNVPDSKLEEVTAALMASLSLPHDKADLLAREAIREGIERTPASFFVQIVQKKLS